MTKIMKMKAGILAVICTFSFCVGVNAQYIHAEDTSIVTNVSEITDEGDYDSFHWAVNTDNQLIISTKISGQNAVISDFYTTLENPDPLSANHFMEIVEYQPWKKYNEKITSVFIEDGITVVGAYAFHDKSEAKRS